MIIVIVLVIKTVLQCYKVYLLHMDEITMTNFYLCGIVKKLTTVPRAHHLASSAIIKSLCYFMYLNINIAR